VRPRLLTEEDIVERAARRSRERRIRFCIFLWLLAVAAAVWAILRF